MIGCIFVKVRRSNVRVRCDRQRLDLRTPSGRPLPY